MWPIGSIVAQASAGGPVGLLSVSTEKRAKSKTARSIFLAEKKMRKRCFAAITFSQVSIYSRTIKVHFLQLFNIKTRELICEIPCSILVVQERPAILCTKPKIILEWIYQPAKCMRCCANTFSVEVTFPRIRKDHIPCPSQGLGPRHDDARVRGSFRFAFHDETSWCYCEHLSRFLIAK